MTREVEKILPEYLDEFKTIKPFKIIFQQNWLMESWCESKTMKETKI